MLLLGVCQTDMLDGLVLIYERIGYGSLHNFLYHTVSSHLLGLVAVVLHDLVTSLLGLAEHDWYV